MIKIGVIGTGTYGETHLDAFLQWEKNFGGVKIVGFAEIDARRRAQIESNYGISGYSDHRKLIEKAEPNAVTVVTPDHLHFRVVMDCLEAGLPVLVEKPLATEVNEAKDMARRAREKNLLLQVDFHKRFDPYHIDLKMRIERGELGKIEYGYFWMEDVLRVGTEMIGKKTWEDQGSPGWFLGIHMIDLSYWLMGCPKPTKVYATGIKGKLQSMGIDIYDSLKAQIIWNNGAVITYDTTVILPDSHESLVRQGCKLVGTEGFMEIDSQYRGARGCTTAKGMETPNLGAIYLRDTGSGKSVKHGYVYDSLSDFLRNVRFLKDGGSLGALEGTYASADDGIETTKAGVGIHESARTGEAHEIIDC